MKVKPMIQAYLTEVELEALIKLQEMYEEETDREFHGLSYNVESYAGRRYRIRRPNINPSFVVRKAIMCLLHEEEQKLASRKMESGNKNQQRNDDEKAVWKTRSIKAEY